MSSPQREGPKAPSPEELAKTLAMLLEPNTETLRRADKIIRNFLKTHHSVGPMLIQIDRCPDERIRQLAAILLRRKIGRFWRKLPDNMRNAAKTMLLQRLGSEPKRQVRVAIAAMIAAIAKIEIPDGNWNDLLPKLSELMNQDQHREVALLLFQALAETIGSALRPHMGRLREIFIRSLHDQNPAVRIQAVQALGVIVDFQVSAEDVEVFRSAIPQFVKIVEECVKTENEQGMGHALRVLEDLIDSNIAILMDSVPQLLEQMGSIAANPELSPNLREASCNFIISLIRDKPGKLVASDLVRPILDLCFRLGTEQLDENPFEATETTPHRLSVELLDTALENFPSRICFGYCLEKCSQLIRSNNPFHIKCGLSFLGVLSDACGEELSQTPQLPQIVKTVAHYIRHEDIVVRTSACWSMSQLADGLSDTINELHREVVPALFQVLDPERRELSSVMQRAAHALESFCDTLGPEIKQYLPRLMDCFGNLIRHPEEMIKNSALRLLSALTLGAKEDFIPYLQKVVEQVIAPLMQLKDPEMLSVRAKAVECAGAILVSVGKEASERYIPNFTSEVLKGFEVDSFELREAGFTFFGYLAITLKDEIPEKVMHPVIGLIVTTLNSDDGVIVHRHKNVLDQSSPNFGGSPDSEDEAGGDLDPDAELSGDEDDILDEEDIMRNVSFSIRSGAVDEKCAALVAVSAMAEHSPRRLLDFIPTVFEAIQLLVEYPNEQIRFHCVQALDEILGCMKSCFPLPSPPVPGKSVQGNPKAMLVVRAVMALLWVRLLEEVDRDVMSTACKAVQRALLDWGMAAMDGTTREFDQSLIQLLKQSKSFDEEEYEEMMAALQQPQEAEEPMAQILGRLIVKLLHQQSPAQRFREDSEDAQVQLDHDILLDYVVDALIAFCKALGGPALGLFRACLPPLREFLRPDKPAEDISMALGCIGDCVGCFTPEQLRQGFPGLEVSETVTQMLQHKEVSIRRNAAYCLGVLVQHSGADFTAAHFTKFLQSLRPLLDTPQEKQKDLDFLGCVDNAVSAICKIIPVFQKAVGEEANQAIMQVVPLIMSCLPLRGDPLEAPSVFPVVLDWMRMQGFVNQYLKDIVRSFAHTLADPQVSGHVKRNLAHAAFALCNPQNGLSDKVKSLLEQQPQNNARAFVEAAKQASTPVNSPQK